MVKQMIICLAIGVLWRFCYNFSETANAEYQQLSKAPNNLLGYFTTNTPNPPTMVNIDDLLFPLSLYDGFNQE